jgi:CRP-like cAMP-binding protein
MKTFPWTEFLQKHPIFATVRDRKHLDALLEDAVSWERTYQPDEVIVRQRDVGDSIFIIGAGSAEAVLELGSGPTLTLSLMRRGEVFGEMALLERRARSATVRAKELCTVLEIRGADFELLMADYPDIEFKLLLKMSERLRNTGEQVLGIQAGSVDEKLKVFSLKLDTEHRLVDSALKAAQTMFDQTKLRTDEVIMSAERGRARLQWTATVIGGFATVIVAVLGVLGAKQIWDVSQIATEMRKVKDEALGGQQVTTKALQDIKQAHVDILAASSQVGPVATAVNDMRAPLTEIVRSRFMNAIDASNMADAKREYKLLKDLAGDDEVHTAVSFLHVTVFTVNPPRDEVTNELLDEVTRDCQRLGDKSARLGDKSATVRAYGLRIAHSVLTGQSRSARQPLYNDLREYLKKNPDAALHQSMIPTELLERIQADQASELKVLVQLTTTKL